ncbi:MAG: NYN domain-containing protein [Chitinophagaceae bacterium]|nr:NYN domain-containing protein [Chitinophagaceae bacterium]
MQNNPMPLALFIDAENANCHQIALILLEAEKLGNPIIRRLYGDFRPNHMDCWQEIAQRHAFTVKHQSSYKKGKNTTDIELIIDAMELLYTGNIQGMILVSGDSDYRGLLQRYREKNFVAYVMGNEHSAQCLRHTATRFISLGKEELVPCSAKKSVPTEPIFRVQSPQLPGIKVVGHITTNKPSLLELVLNVMKLHAEDGIRIKQIDFINAFQRMYKNVSLQQAGFKNWRQFFNAHPAFFERHLIEGDTYLVIKLNK